MTDKEPTEQTIAGAWRANRDLGDTSDGRSILGNDKTGSAILSEYERAQKLESENIRDHLTGAFNRRYLESEARKLAANEDLFSIVFLDIDEFRRFNNVYGHDLGDAALKHLANVAEGEVKSARPTGKEDVFARWGGEEFMILLRDVSDLEVAVKVAGRVRTAVENSTFKDNDGKNLILTVSGGVASRREGEKLEETIKRADEGLLKAKALGKNRIESN